MQIRKISIRQFCRIVINFLVLMYAMHGPDFFHLFSGSDTCLFLEGPVEYGVGALSQVIGQLLERDVRRFVGHDACGLDYSPCVDVVAE